MTFAICVGLTSFILKIRNSSFVATQRCQEWDFEEWFIFIGFLNQVVSLASHEALHKAARAKLAAFEVKGICVGQSDLVSYTRSTTARMLFCDPEMRWKEMVRAEQAAAADQTQACARTCSNPEVA